MEQTANLQLPYIMPSQAQKHVTHNEAIRSLDALVQLAVRDRDLPAPPGVIEDGERYLVAPGGTGAWTGQDGRIAAWQDGAWAFLTPRAGWLAWVADEDRLLAFDGDAWIDAAVHSLNPVPLMGVHMTADDANRLSVRSPATLLDEEDGDHRLKINKAASGDTASLIFQSGYSGRAEFGLAGDDDWHVKVSGDGANWIEALAVDRMTGRATLPAALPLDHQDQIATKRHVRDMLHADRIYHVRPDGSDINDGLGDSAGGAFLTIQKAMDTVATIDLNGHGVTIRLGDGAYEGFTVPAMVGQSDAGKLVVSGDAAMPGNVVISGSVVCPAGSSVTLRNLNISTGSSGFGLNVSGGVVDFGNVEFGACLHHIFVQNGGIVTATGDYAVVGPASRHWWVRNGGIVIADFQTVTITGTPAFTSFALCQQGTILCGVMTFVGSATGARYSVQLNGVINANGGGAAYLPGSAAGTALTGGQYA